MTFVGTVQTGSNAVQTIELVGDTAVVFNRPVMWSSLVSSSDKSAICGVYSDVRFDTATSTFKVRYNFREYMADAQCQTILLPENHGHHVVIDGVTGRRLSERVVESHGTISTTLQPPQGHSSQHTTTSASTSTRHTLEGLNLRDIGILSNSVPSPAPSASPSRANSPQPTVRLSSNPTLQPIIDPTPEPTVEPPSGPDFTPLQLSVVNDYEIDVDMRVIALAMAVNLGVVDLNTMEQAGQPIYFEGTLMEFLRYFSVAWSPAAYYIQDYFNPQYPGMTPISCVFNSTKSRQGLQRVPSGDQFLLCLYKVGSGYFMPVFHQLGGPDVPIRGTHRLSSPHSTAAAMLRTATASSVTCFNL